MRIGQNPAKSIDHVAQPAPITVAVITYIPFLSGYYRDSLDVLKICLNSILGHTDQPFDLMVFDNASCSEVVSYLGELHAEKLIQYLILSDKNIGKVGAWNVIFGAAPGDYIAYADSDVYFFPDWLPRHREVFEVFPEAGTVCGLPRRGRRTFYSRTIESGSDIGGVAFEEGKFIPDEWIVDHARSLDKLDTVEKDLELNDYRFTRDGTSAYATATHFQFMVKKETIQNFLPFPYDRPMGDSVAHLDRAINDNNLLRLAVTERVVQHIGNKPDEHFLATLPDNLISSGSISYSQTSRRRNTFYDFKPVKRLLLRLYDRIFRIYYG
jgi:glycosyltransferase involved in cell wall biosynthesis